MSSQQSAPSQLGFETQNGAIAVEVIIYVEKVPGEDLAEAIQKLRQTADALEMMAETRELTGRYPEMDPVKN